MNFTSRIALVLLVCTGLSSCRFSADASDRYVGSCNVRFHADVTLHSFDGDITNLPLTVVCSTNSEGSVLLNTRIEIKPRQLTTHNTDRDAHMYQMFLEDRFPKLVVVVTNAPLAAANLSGQTKAPGVLPTQLIFCGVTREVRSVTSNPQDVAEGWEFDLDTDISLKAFNLKPPTALLGAMKVHDLVKVKAHVKLQKEPP